MNSISPLTNSVDPVLDTTGVQSSSAESAEEEVSREMELTLEAVIASIVTTTLLMLSGKTGLVM